MEMLPSAAASFFRPEWIFGDIHISLLAARRVMTSQIGSVQRTDGPVPYEQGELSLFVLLKQCCRQEKG